VANRKNPSPFQYRGRWRAQVTLKNGSRPFKDFDKCADARQWIVDQLALANTPHEARLGGPTQATLADAMTYYAGVYTVTKGGAKAELDRINHYLEGAGKAQLKLKRNEDGVLSVEAVKRRKKAPKAFQAHSDARRAVRQATYERIARLANKRCSTISTADIRELMADMAREGLSASTIQKEVALLRHLFNVAAIEWDWAGFKNPCQGIKLGKSNQRFVFLTKPQTSTLWQALGECDNPLFQPLTGFALETLLRLNSLLSLEWEKVDLDGRVLHVRSKTGPVDIALTQRAVSILQALPRHPSGRVFPLSANAVDMAWDGVRTKAGLPKLQFRDLRHLGATEFARRGLTAPQLARMLGHKSLAMAQVYINLVQQDMLETLDRVEPATPVLTLAPLDKQTPGEVVKKRRSERLAAAVRSKLAQEQLGSPVAGSQDAVALGDTEAGSLEPATFEADATASAPAVTLHGAAIAVAPVVAAAPASPLSFQNAEVLEDATWQEQAQYGGVVIKVRFGGRR